MSTQKFGANRLAMFENMGKPPPKGGDSGGAPPKKKFGGDRTSFLARLEAAKTSSDGKASTPGPPAKPVKTGAGSASVGGGGGGGKSAFQMRLAAAQASSSGKPQSSNTSSNGPPPAPGGSGGGPPAAPSDSKSNGGGGPPPAPSTSEPAAKPPPKKKWTPGGGKKRTPGAAAGLNINLGALRPGAVRIPKKRKEGPQDMETPTLQRPTTQTGRRKRKSRRMRASSLDLDEEASALSVPDADGHAKRWSVLGPASAEALAEFNGVLPEGNENENVDDNGFYEIRGGSVPPQMPSEQERDRPTTHSIGGNPLKPTQDSPMPTETPKLEDSKSSPDVSASMFKKPAPESPKSKAKPEQKTEEPKPKKIIVSSSTSAGKALFEKNAAKKGDNSPSGKRGSSFVPNTFKLGHQPNTNNIDNMSKKWGAKKSPTTGANINDSDGLRKEIQNLEKQLQERKVQLAVLERKRLISSIENMKPIDLLKNINKYCETADKRQLDIIRKILDTHSS